LTPDEEHAVEDGRSGEEEVIEIDEMNSSVIGERRSESSYKSEVCLKLFRSLSVFAVNFQVSVLTLLWHSALETFYQVCDCF